MATTLYFRTAAASMNGSGGTTNLRGTAYAFVANALATTRGAAAATRSGGTVLGATPGVEVNDAASGNPAEWLSEPLAADVTISGSITWNIWAYENNMAANVAINGRLEVIDGATGAITLIDQTARVTELGTSSAVANFAETPAAGVACKRGDRLRVRIFGDDAGTMASGYIFYASIDGPTAAANGDSYFTLTENLTFEAEPAGSTIYLTDTASAVATASVDREAWTARGAGVVNDVTNTVAGWTTGVHVTDTAGGTVVDWFTRPLTAFTLGGAVRCNIRASGTDVTMAVAVEVARVNGDGTSPVTWARGTGILDLSASEVAQSLVIAGDDLAVTAGQRLRIRLLVDDSSTSGPLAGGFAATTFYAGTTGGASGDTFLTFAQTLTENVSAIIRTAADSYSTSDSVARGLTLIRGVADTRATTDAVTRQATLARAVADTRTTTDAAAQIKILPRAVADSIPTTDAAARQATLARTAADTRTTTDAVTRQGTFARTVADTRTTTDAAAGSKILPRTVADNVPTSDAVTRQATLARTAADTRTTTDAVTRQGTFARTVADTRTTSDSVNRLGTFVRSVADTLTGSDIVGRVLTALRGVSDSAPVTESVASVKTGGGALTRTVADTVTTTDAVTRQGTFGRTAADSIPTSDAVTRQATLPRAAADSIPTTDAVTRQATLGRTVADTRTTTDAVTRQGTFVRAMADSVPTSDSVARVQIYVRTAADTVTTSDAVTRQSTAIREFGDTRTTSDLIERIGTFLRGLADTRSTSDAVAGVQVTLTIAGITRDSAGVALAGCTVHLFRTVDDVEVGQLVSSGTGAFSFTVAPGVAHYIVAYLPGAPDRAGTSVNTLTGI